MKITFDIQSNKNSIKRQKPLNIPYENQGSFCNVILYGNIANPNLKVIPLDSLHKYSIPRNSKYLLSMNISWSKFDGFRYVQYSNPNIKVRINKVLCMTTGSIKGNDKIQINGNLLSINFKAKLDDKDLNGKYVDDLLIVSKLYGIGIKNSSYKSPFTKVKALSSNFEADFNDKFELNHADLKKTEYDNVISSDKSEKTPNNSDKSSSSNLLKFFAGAGLSVAFIAVSWELLQYKLFIDDKAQYREEAINSIILPSENASSAQSIEVDVDNLINGIVELDADNPSPKFQNAINETNEAVLLNVADQYGFSNRQKQSMIKEYQASSQDIIQSNFDELKKLSQNRKNLGSSSFVKVERYEVANDFHAILSDNLCFITNTFSTIADIKYGGLVGNLIVDEKISNLTVKNLCTYIARKPLFELVKGMKERGLILDIVESQHHIDDHTRNIITELATEEDSFSLTRSDSKYRKIKIHAPRFNIDIEDIPWFKGQRTAKVTINSKSIIKAGFKLDESFRVEIDQEKRKMFVTLPKPQILSNSTDYEFTEAEDAWLTKITTEEYNRLLKDLKEISQQAVIDKGILSDAEKNAEVIIKQLYRPITSLPGANLDVIVQFENN